jgi:hypothetical protein
LAKKKMPSPLKLPNFFQPFEDASRCACEHDLLWIMVRLHEISRQTTSSWTGFNIRKRRHSGVSAEKVEYLPTINMPQRLIISTAQENLCNCFSNQETLSLKEVGS